MIRDKNIFFSAFTKIEKDDRLHTSHISLYIVLLNLWYKNQFQNPINISRKEILASCKIKSNATYHKCIKELNDFGYIKYEPSYDPFKGSLIHMIDFSHEANSLSPETKTVNILSSNNKEILIRISLEN